MNVVDVWLLLAFAVFSDVFVECCAVFIFLDVFVITSGPFWKKCLHFKSVCCMFSPCDYWFVRKKPNAKL